MVHTFEEIRARNPTNPSEAALEATMPQAAWEALLQDAVHGLRPPYTPQIFRRWLQTTHPMAWAIGAPQAPHPHPTTTTPGRGRARARGGQGRGRDAPARGQGKAQNDRQAPTGTGQRERHNTGAENHPWAKEEKEQGPWRRERGNNGGHQSRKGMPQQRDQHRPTPIRHRATAGGAGPKHTPPKHESDTVGTTPAHAHQPPETTNGKVGTPTRGEGAIPTEGAAGDTAAQPTTRLSPPGSGPRHSKGHLTGTRRGRGHGHSTQG